jgi:SAM-dependent methyltransferase
MRIDGTDKADSWESIYKQGDAGWDIGKPAPPFESLLAERPDWLKKGSMVCFGAGNGHDADLFARSGFEVTAVDFAPSAVASIKSYAENNSSLTPFEGDILALPDKLNSSFDYVLEHTCFCAIPVENREKYVEAAYKALKPGGAVFGLFYRFDPPDEKGPPFAVTEEELRSLFIEKFEIVEFFTPEKSHGRRQNRERFIMMKVKK